MPHFTVTIKPLSLAERTIEVDADNVAEAKEYAGEEFIDSLVDDDIVVEKVVAHA